MRPSIHPRSVLLLAIVTGIGACAEGVGVGEMPANTEQGGPQVMFGSPAASEPIAGSAGVGGLQSSDGPSMEEPDAESDTGQMVSDTDDGTDTDPTSPAGTDDSDEAMSGWIPSGSGPEPAASPTPSASTDTGDCPVLAHNTDSGAFGTTGAVCFTVMEQPPYAWEGYNLDGRTITINGMGVSPGQLPFPGSAPFTVEFSAGTHPHASWAYW